MHTVLFEQGKIFIKEAEWTKALKQELLNFPASSHDDQVDALSQALTYLKQNKSI